MNLTPKMTLSDIFGKDLILNPRGSFSDYGWLPKNPAKIDFLTGAPLTIAGEMPIICSSTVATEDILNLLRESRLDVATLRLVYHKKEDYYDILNLFNAQEKKLVINHPHPNSEIHHQTYWIDPKLLGFLNNKAQLKELVPKEYIPARLTIHPNKIAESIKEFNSWPIIIKAASDEPNGGGYDVMICNSKEEIDDAYQYFSTCHTVVVEEYIDIEKSYNIQFARTIKEDIVYLGVSEQITTPSGIYIGNWLEKNLHPSEEIIKLGYAIMKKASSLGFIGICGFDIVVAKDNRIYAIDLNFRLNGSTAAVLLQDSIYKSYDSSAILFQNWDSKYNWNKFFPSCRKAMKELNFIPLAFNKPIAPYYSDLRCYVSGILLAPLGRKY
ncbi:ATP-grasp domain-containing protein [Alkaliphilus serpentinus]|nr:ATP-grasp domain-containing protein [Alkaliphilus serpentinus]